MFGYWEYAIVVLVWVAGGGGVMLAAPYLVLRLRDARNSRRDPQLGLKVALHFLMSTGLLIGITGATVALAAIIEGADPSGFGPSPAETRQRGFALLIAGSLIMGLYAWAIASRTNDRRWPAVRRTYCGIRFIVEGLVFITGVCGVLVLVMSPDSDAHSEGSQFVAMLIIWGVAMTVELLLLMRFVRTPEVPGLDTKCVLCGYDLRGRSDAVACSECGTLIVLEQRELLRPAPLAASASAAGPAAGITPS